MRNDKRIIFAVIAPGAGRHIAYFDESPIRHVGWWEAQMIADGWRNTQTCIMTCVRRRPLILKNVLEMIGAKRAAIFPLGVADSIPLANGDPAILAHRLTRLRIDLFEPRDDSRRFRLELPLLNIVIWQRAVKRILTRNERDRDVIMPSCRLRIVHSAKVLQPILVPNALVLWRRFFRRLFFTDPKNCCDDVCFPGKNVS
jgi:hypothetical protein